MSKTGERSIVSAMKIFQRIFDISWRLAILALPWQARWFSDASLGGWPWEQGRISFYASWIPMLVVVVLSARAHRECIISAKNKKWIYVGIGTLAAVSAANIIRDHAAIRPILQWWVQIVILTFFILTLWRAKISQRSLAAWFVISIIPHALLGIWQFSSQQVVGSKWLGIATQLPQTLGVSVVAHDGLRILRAYGGFPHPNIFGGWLAVGAVVAVWLAMTSAKRRDGIVWTVASSLFMSALVLTFARGAWIAAAVGFITVLLQQKKVRAIFFIPLLVFSLVLITQRQHVFARFDLTQRLEQKSVDERIGSLRTGIDLFVKHPMIGSGPNAELLALASTEKTGAPLEPSHNVFLLALDDFGVVGFFAICAFLILGLKALRKRSSPFIISAYLVPLVAIALVDHYLWSTWSGQALAAIVILLTVEPKIDS